MRERMIAGTLWISLIGLVAPGIADAQETRTSGSGQIAERSDEGGGAYVFVDELQDRQVVNSLGEEIGDLSRIIVRGDRVTHAIISIGGFLGLGGSDIVVPFDVLTFEGDQVVIETLASADQIGELTLFDPGDFGLSN